MSYERKTSRPNWVYDLRQLRRMAEEAARTSTHAAAVKFGCNWNTIRAACERTGIAARRRKSNAKAKAQAIKMRRAGATYAAIGEAVGYHSQSVHNWCRDAGIDVDCRVKEGAK
jgi:hypothetical protein